MQAENDDFFEAQVLAGKDTQSEYIMPQILVAPTWLLAQSLAPAVTIEAEYGSFVAEGSKFTAAHHQKEGPYSQQRAPCNNNQIPQVRDGVVLLSHLDLDSIGGALRTLEGFETLFDQEFQGFWELAEFVDLHGPHMFRAAGASREDINAWYAYQAWAATGVPRLSPTEITDVTDTVVAVGRVLCEILRGDQDLLAGGFVFVEQQRALNTRTFRRLAHFGVVVREATVARDFCNHLYVTPSSEIGRAVVSWNHETGAITLSLAEPTLGIDCRAMVQELWGPEAGGRDVIAGSPRGQRMTQEDFDHAVVIMVNDLDTIISKA